MYTVCILVLVYYIYVVFYQVELIWVCSYFKGDSACFSAEVLTPFSVCSGRGNLIVCGPDIRLMSVIPQGPARVPGWNSGRVLSDVAPSPGFKD